jgi:protein involved in polysaccharide export with SLBB domain
MKRNSNNKATGGNYDLRPALMAFNALAFPRVGDLILRRLIAGFQILLWTAWVAGAGAQALTNTDNGSGALISTNSIRASVGYTLDEKHLLEPGDKVSFQVLEDQHPPVTLAVTDSGELDVPYLGRVPVAGKTCSQVAAELKPRLEKDYFYHATVIVGLDSVNPLCGQAYISGEVRNPGAVNLLFNQDLTVGEAIIRVGGFTEFADERKVKLVRRSKTAGAAPQIFIVNVEDVLEKGKTQDDMVLKPGDYVFVPARVIRF